MGNKVLALLIALTVHALLAVAICAYLECAPCPDVVATLDLASVELSFAEEERERAPAAAADASSPRPLPKPRAEPAPSAASPEKPLPPEPLAAKLRNLPEEAPEMFSEERPTPPAPAAEAPAAAVAPRQARVDAPPKPKRAIRPDYPRGARQRGEEGSVVLEIGVTAEGTVETARVVVSSGFAELDEAAVRAAKAARFSPARSGREAVASTARLKLEFRLK